MKFFSLLMMILCMALVIEALGVVMVAVETRGLPDVKSYKGHYEATLQKDGNLKKSLEIKDYDGLIVANPLYGYQVNPQAGGNNYGFYTRGKDLPYKKSAGEFVIAILGSSVAHQFADYIEETPGAFEKLEKKLKKKVVIFNLAQAGMKQPQPYVIASNFYESFDLIINIDGYMDNFNEAQADLPPEYPTLTNGLYFMTPQKKNLFEKAKLLRRLRARLAFIPLSNPLMWSSFYYFLWEKLDPQLASKHMNVEEELLYHASPSLRFSFKVEKEKRQQSLLNIWSKYTHLQSELLHFTKTRSLHFLSPNMYLEGAKSLTQDEKKMIQQTPAKDRLDWSLAYKKVREEYQRLGKSGVATMDLSMVFSKTKESVYKDQGSHLNDLGNQILLEAVAHRVGEAQ
jgi:hypothetical protein